MRDSRIRVLLPKGLAEHEITAAQDAAGRFRRFGLRVEAMRDYDGSVWKDLCRKRVYESVFSQGPLVLHGEEPFGRPDYFSRVPNDGAILAAVVPRQIVHQQGGRRAELEGFNLQYVGAVVSSIPFMPSEAHPYRDRGALNLGESSAAIELCIAHELGHSLLGREPVSALFGKKDEPRRYDDIGHCMTSGCLMQNVSDYVALVRSVAAERMDFCDGCADLLRGRVTEIRWHAMA